MLKGLVAAAALIGGLLASGGAAFAAPSGGHAHWMHSCDAASGAVASCNAIVNTAAKSPSPGATAAHSGYAPADLQAAYGLAAASANGYNGYANAPMVAIVDAYNDPYAASDLSTYRSAYGLPSCTTSNGCLRITGQSGTRLPVNNASWSEEISLDLDMVSAICPNCRILLVEASSASFANLGAAVNYAASQHPVAISNSYGGSDASDGSYGRYYQHPGIAVTASAGDSGYGVEYPASSDYVTAVGGTSLARSSNSRSWTETAWSGTGSGCSSYNAQPSWQSGVVASCSKRAVADVSADADPNSGVAVYDSYSYQGYRGWLVFGGTSVASPIIASVYALAGNAATVTAGTAYGSSPYVHGTSSNLNDVSSGSNGSCGGTDLCTAGPGWDGPTGLGTPNGVTAF